MREIVAVPGRVEGDVVELEPILPCAVSGWCASTATRRTWSGSNASVSTSRVSWASRRSWHPGRRRLMGALLGLTLAWDCSSSGSRPWARGSRGTRRGRILHRIAGMIAHREGNPSDEESTLVVVRAGTGDRVTNVEGPPLSELLLRPSRQSRKHQTCDDPSWERDSRRRCVASTTQLLPRHRWDCRGSRPLSCTGPPRGRRRPGLYGG